jgi:hypothetical protein
MWVGVEKGVGLTPDGSFICIAPDPLCWLSLLRKPKEIPLFFSGVLTSKVCVLRMFSDFLKKKKC